MAPGRFENVLDAVLDVLGRHGLDNCTRLSAPHHPGRRELTLFGMSEGFSDQTTSALRDIEKLDAIGSVSVGKKDKVGMRLSDRCVLDLGEMLESGAVDAVKTDDLGQGQEFSVGFCNRDTTTKALHVGHLRNIALGNGIAAVLQACGATVVTQSLGGDHHAGSRCFAEVQTTSPAGTGKTFHLFHGAVAVDDQLVKSAAASAWLIDDLLEEIVSRPEIEAASTGDPERAERLAVTAALGFFLGYPTTKPLSISRDDLLDPRVNAGWAIVSASLKAWDSQFDGPPDPSTLDRDYRFLLAQSQVHRQLARRVRDELNPVFLAHFHARLCRWFLSTACTARLARAMRTVLSTGIASLGLPGLLGDNSLTTLRPTSQEMLN